MITNPAPSMPVYYFHILSERGVHPDVDGVQLPDAADAVKREAIDRALLEMAAVRAVDEDRTGWRFDVRDERDRKVLDFPFADAIPTG